jgi:hypothetical protein
MLTANPLILLAGLAAATAEPGFVPLFDGASLDGWYLVAREGAPYYVRDGVLVCPKETNSNLYTVKEYRNFVLRLDFLRRSREVTHLCFPKMTRPSREPA